jgi:hypothetical protein
MPDDERAVQMMFSPSVAWLGQTARRVLVVAASLAVVATFAGTPVSSAATGHSSSRPGHGIRPPQSARLAPARRQVVRHHAAPPAADLSALRSGEFAALHRSHWVAAAIAKPSRPAKPAAIARQQVKLWHGTPSYTLQKNVRQSAASILAISGACQITSGNHSGTWSASACPHGYEVQGDVTVPVGKTLTIKANTDVYFDTTVEGSLTPGDPSELTDLIVDGTLTVAGTSADPVLLTSANAAPGSSVSPAAGDWGYVFFNHTGSDKGAGSITGMRLLYGEGIASDRSAPPITSSTISNVAAGVTVPLIATSIEKGAGIDYEDIPGGTVTFSHDVFDGAQVAGIELDSSYSHVAFNGGTVAGHAYTLHLTDSKITGGGTTGLEDAFAAYSETNGGTLASNHSGVTLNVHGNHITQTTDDTGFEVEAESTPTVIAGTAAITGVFSHNIVTGGDDSEGTDFYASAGDSTKTGTTACKGRSACIIVPFMSDRVSSYDEAVENEAVVNNGSGGSLVDTAVGKVVKKKVKKTFKKHHKVHHKTVIKHVDTGGGIFRSADDDAWDTEAYDYGTGSAASVLPIVASTFDSYDENVFTEAEAYYGTATNSVPVRHSSMTSHDDQNIYTETYGSNNGAPPSGSSGGAGTTVRVTGGHWAADDENIYNDETEAGYGPAATHVTVSGATLTSADTSIETDTYGSDDGGSGGAVSDVTVTKSTLSAEESAVENEADASHGSAPATAKVTASGSKLNAYDDDGVDNDAYAAQDAGSHGNATVDTSIGTSKLQVYDDALDLEAESLYGGSATSSPKVTDSTIVSADDDALSNEAYGAEDAGSGAATADPSISGSTITSEDEVVYNEAESFYGSGKATGNPTITSSTVSSADDYAIDNEVFGTDKAGSTGSASGNPVISGGSAVAEEYLIYNEVYGYYGAAAGSPMLKNTSGLSGDDYAIYNEVYGSDDAGSGSATANPKITGSTVNAYEYGIYNEAYSYGGKATANPEISHSKVVAADDYLIYNEGYANESRGTGATATGNPRIIDSTTTSEDQAVYNEIYSYEGPAVANPTIKNSTLTVTDDDAVDNYAYGSYSGGTGSATAKPVISGSTITAEDYGVENEAYGYRGSAVAEPAISTSHVKSLFDGNVYNEAYGGDATAPGSAVAKPVVSHTPLYCGDCSSEYGVYNEASSTEGAANASPTVTSSAVRNADGYGVYNEAYSATSSGHGAAAAHPAITSSPITSYRYGLYSEADAENGNSSADASFTVTASKIVSLDYEAIEAQAYGHGTGTTTVDPSVTSADVRSPDDDAIDLDAEPNGTGAAAVGGHISHSTLTSEDDDLDVDAAGAAGAASSFTTTLHDDTIVSVDDDAIYADYGATGAALTMAPVITGGSITADDDYALYLYADGYGGASTDELRVAPTISGTPIISEDGVSLESVDTSGSAEPGHTVVEGSVKDSSIVSTEDYGVYADAACTYCEGGAKTAVTVTDTPINGDDGAGYFTASTASTSPASATVGGSATSTHHDLWTAIDGYAIYAYATSAEGHASNSFKASGLHLSGEEGSIYNGADAPVGNATNTSSFTSNLVDNESSSSGEDGIYDETLAGGNATRTGTVSHNSVSDLPGDSEGIYLYLDAAGEGATKLTVAHNTVSNIGGWGIDVESYWSTAEPSSDLVTIDHNSVSRTGNAGMYFAGIKPSVTSNRVSSAGLAGTTSDAVDGMYITGTPYQGTVTCNAIWANPRGIEYGASNPTTGSGGHNGDPKTNDNSFRALKGTTRNSLDLMSGNIGAGTTDAQNNYWGGSPRLASPASRYDTTPRLSKAPKCVKTAGA